MDFYYRKSMGNGTVASKFRLSAFPPSILSNQSNLRGSPKSTSATSFNSKSSKSPTTDAQRDAQTVISLNNNTKEKSEDTLRITDSSDTSDDGVVSKKDVSLKPYPVEFPETHHPNNCNRCYRLKKKCSREYPRCTNCSKAGCGCEYVTRSNKRRRRTPGAKNIKHIGQHSSIDSNGVVRRDSQEEPVTQEVFHIEETNNKADKIDIDSSADKSVVAHKLVSVSSLLSNNEEHRNGSTFNSRDITPRPRKVPSAALSSMARREREREISIEDKLAKKSLQSIKTNLKEEFITMKSVSHPDIPTTFVYNYLENFSYRYPFIDKSSFLKRFHEIDFLKESIINLDVYLVMSIGCLIYDTTADEKLFSNYFNDKSIESIIDGLNFSFNGNYNEEEDLANVELLLLLVIYSITSLNEELCWGLVGVLDRLIIQMDLYKSSSNIRRSRLFWSVYNIDKELSLLLDKPSQAPQKEFIGLQLPLTDKLYDDEELNLISQEIEFAQLQDRVLYLKLTNNRDSGDLTALSSALEKWRVTTSSAIHKVYSSSDLLQQYTSLVNLNYYYLLVEIDQISPSQSFQFTLQFISNSFALVIAESELKSGSETSSKKQLGHISLKSSLLWYRKLFKVISFNLDSLSKIIDSKELGKLDLSLRLSEFNSNLQLMLNLLKFIYKDDFKGTRAAESINEYAGVFIKGLGQLNTHLMDFNVMVSKDEDRARLSQHIDEVRSSWH
ncbi:uncharacterized protein RJT20DRAFT_131565 [Scheffersomyces xylosifermentans]|uniref:uncharacterized protein n=1 Tax=Scheffersomyces xylosifermentans TaxID=1304137 RepID=UPI00315CA090